MPGMPIFQDSPGQLKGQLYVVDSASPTDALIPLQGTSGNLAVAGTVDLAAGAEVDLAAGATVALASGTTVGLTSGTEVDLAAGATVALASGTTVGLTSGTEVDLAAGATVALASGTTVGLTSGTEVDLAAGATVALASGTEVDLAAGATVALASGTNVGLSAGSNVIGKVQTDPVFTYVDAFSDPTPLTSKAVGATATVVATAQDISKQTSYNWFIRNTGTTDTTQDITLIVEISPDNSYWLEDTGTVISVPYSTSAMITVTHFLQYARYTITGGSAATTVISCFQAQH